MNQRMPQEIQELFDKIVDDEKYLEFQDKWSNYISMNEKYQRDYPVQFANLVAGNSRFGQAKSLQTPAEQMRMYTDMARTEMQNYLDDYPKEEKLPELTEQEKETEIDRVQNLALTLMKDYKENQEKTRSKTPEQTKDEGKSSYDFRLVFENMDFREDGPELEKDMDDLEREY